MERRQPPSQQEKPITVRQFYESVLAANPDMSHAERIALAKQLGGRVVRRPRQDARSTSTPSAPAPHIAPRVNDPEHAAPSAVKVKVEGDGELTSLLDALHGELDVPALIAGLTEPDEPAAQQDIELGEIPPTKSAPVAEANTGDADNTQTGNRLRFSNLTRKQKIGLAAIAAALVAGTGTAVTVAASNSPGDTCTSVTTQAVPRGADLTEIAQQMEESRNYAVDPDRVLQANAKVHNMDTGENLNLQATGGVEAASEALKKKDSRFCFVVPAPIALGQQESTGTMNIQQIADSVGQSADTLKTLNADIIPKDPNAPLPKGALVWLDKTLDTGLVLRKFHGQSLHELTGGNYDATQKLVDANIFMFIEQDAIELKSDGDYFLPYTDADTTPAMRAMGITPADILKAYKTRLTYETRNEPVPTPEAAAPTTPESKQVLTDHITDKQRQSIETMNLQPAQKEFIAKALDIIMKTQGKAEERHINTTVLLAQLIRESGYGTSEISRVAQNYTGMKANDGWTGPTTGNQFPSGAYRVYPDLETSIAGPGGYYENLSSPTKPWYNDARDHYKDWQAYLAGLQNEDPHSYAEDPNYVQATAERITTLHLDELINVDGLTTIEVAPAAAQQPEQQSYNIKLNPAAYKNNPRQSELPGNSAIAPKDRPPYSAAAHTGPWLMYHGEPKLSSELTYKQRLELVEGNLNGIRISPEAFQQFQIVDVRAQVAADADLTNFHGTKEDPQTPNVHKDVKFFVWHFTATNTSASSHDGYVAAKSMQNGGRGVGIQYYTQGDGTVYSLTDKFTYHTLNQKQPDGSTRKYNRMAFGVEIAACEQADISSKQYENAIYLSAKFLIDNSFINKNDSVTKVVNQMIIGHHEANPGGHSDNPGIVMDQIRPLIIDLLVKMGYKA